MANSAMTDTPEPSRCPLCGQANQCGQCNPDSTERSCWCFSASVAPEALERIPDEARGKACLCARCASGKTVEHR